MNDAAITQWDTTGGLNPAMNVTNTGTTIPTPGATGTTNPIAANTATDLGKAIDPSQSTLSASFGPYVQDMLSKGWGAANQPYQPFTGDRFAPASTLQQQAFAGYGGLGAYQPTQFNTGLGAVGSVQDYMNPYLQSVVDVQAREARRQAEIQRNMDQARFVQAGGYGGSRQAIVDAERNRNLGTQIGDIQAKGLAAAFEQAQKQRLQEAGLGLQAQQYGEQAQQFGAGQGLRNLAEQLKAGEAQRAIEQQPLEFGYQQFQESMKYPYQQATYMQSLLQGLPLEAPKYDAGDSLFGSLMQGGIGGLALYQMLFGNK